MNDIKIICRKRSDAVRMFYATKDFLKHRLHLEIDDNKSKIVNLKRRSIDFLGFRIKTKNQQAKRTDIVIQTSVAEDKKKEIKKRIKTDYKNFAKNKNKLDLIKKSQY